MRINIGIHRNIQMESNREGRKIEIKLPSEIGDGRLDTIIKIFDLIRSHKEITLNWRRVQNINPAGFAILACLFDSAVEQHCELKNLFLKKEIKNNIVIQNLLNINSQKTLPKPEIHHFHHEYGILRGLEKVVYPGFMEEAGSKATRNLSPRLFFYAKSLINELMVNAYDHSTSERYYLYAGKISNELLIGVLDLGATIPAKMAQKYNFKDDLEYLENALKKGTTTRRIREGGLGLFHTLETLRQSKGKLTIISGNAQIRRYFKSRIVRRKKLKVRLRGTWCFARFPLE